MQERKADLGKIDLGARSVPIVLSTDYPVERGDYIEVLDASKVDLSRGDLPLIESHDAQKLNIGVVRNIRAEGGKLRGIAVFGNSTRANEILADVREGIVTGVSIGYRLTDDGDDFPLRDGRTARRFGFMPYEVSIVSIPADPHAGFNRSHPVKPKGIVNMNMQSTRTAHEVETMIALGEAHSARGGERLAAQYLREGKSVEELRDALLDLPYSHRAQETVSVRNVGQQHQREESSIGRQFSRKFEENRELFEKTRSLRLQIRAASDLITTSSGRTIMSGGVGFVSGGVLGFQNALRIRAEQTTALEYSRYTGQQGAAAVQAAEGDTKAAVRPDHTLITQSALTIAGYAKMSRQAMRDSSELERSVEVTLNRSIATALDAALVNGATGFVGGFEGLATSYTSLVYTSLVDSVSEGVATMQTAGFNPDVVGLNPTDWLAITTAKGTSNDHYLSGSYLSQVEPVLRGLRVVLSPSIDAGKAMVIDSSHSELLIVEDFSIELGYTSDDFIKNQAVLLGEMRVLPVFRTVGSARLITPKA